MYVPTHFRARSNQHLFALMREYSFATLVTMVDERPIATHLPFIINTQNNPVKLKSHLARANHQWKSFEGDREALVIFSGPHAYISPSLYEGRLNVPTWDYAAVHAYGVPRIISDRDAVTKVLISMIENFEPSYKSQWASLSEHYKERVLAGIVAFEIEVTRLEGAFKLSQNRSEVERARIVETLERSESTSLREMARMMRDT